VLERTHRSEVFVGIEKKLIDKLDITEKLLIEKLVDMLTKRLIDKLIGIPQLPSYVYTYYNSSVDSTCPLLKVSRSTY
jgi:hypothetical protein